MEEMTVRGIKGGVLISLPEKAWYQQRDILVSRIQSQERFFKGGRIALDVGGSDWTAEQLFKLLRDLSDEGVCLWAVLTSSEITLEAAKSFDLQTSISALNAPEEPQEPQLGAGVEMSHSAMRFVAVSFILGLAFATYKQEETPQSDEETASYRYHRFRKYPIRHEIK